MSARKTTPRTGASTAGRTAAQKRAAAQRALAAASGARAERRRRLVRVLGPIAAVVVVVVVLVVVKIATGSGGPKSGQKATAAQSGVIAEVTAVPPKVLDSVGLGSVRTLPKPITGGPLIQDGKPQVRYVGAEYCPYCATERWAVVVALSRFGAFTGLGQTASSPSDVYPSTATLTFHGASYRSTSVSFTGTETQSNQVVNGQYAPLDPLSAADRALLSKYDNGGGIPFIDIGGRYVISGASYDPQVLQGKTHAQIAAALSDAASPIAQGVDGTANAITATICASTNAQPARVCTAPGVTAAKAKLPHASG